MFSIVPPYLSRKLFTWYNSSLLQCWTGREAMREQDLNARALLAVFSWKRWEMWLTLFVATTWIRSLTNISIEEDATCYINLAPWDVRRPISLSSYIVFRKLGSYTVPGVCIDIRVSVKPPNIYKATIAMVLQCCDACGNLLNESMQQFVICDCCGKSVPSMRSSRLLPSI